MLPTPIRPADLVRLAVTGPVLTVLACWEAACRLLGLLPEPAPQAPEGALVLAYPDGARITLHPAAAPPLVHGGAR